MQITEEMLKDVLNSHDLYPNDREIEDIFQALDLEELEMAAGYGNVYSEKLEKVQAAITENLIKLKLIEED